MGAPLSASARPSRQVASRPSIGRTTTSLTIRATDAEAIEVVGEVAGRIVGCGRARGRPAAMSNAQSWALRSIGGVDCILAISRVDPGDPYTSEAQPHRHLLTVVITD